MTNPYKPGPVITRKMTPEELAAGRKRREELQKQIKPKKPASYYFPIEMERQARG